MPIISKTTWDKFTQEEKERIRKLYEHYEDDALLYRDEPHKLVKANLESIFPKEALHSKPLTYEEVARNLFCDKDCYHTNEDGEVKPWSFGKNNAGFLCPNNCTSQKQAEKLLAINKLLNVASYLNKNEDGTPWKPDWENLEEKKWYPSLSDSEIKISYVMRDSSSPVYFRTEELAKQAVTILGEDTVRLALTTEY